jgi:hypothetical protein
MDRMNRTGQIMLLRKAMIALGFIGTIAAATATPSLAQGVYSLCRERAQRARR